MTTDIVIFGGGIAGLWALNRLRNLGFHAILLETQALGAGQTLKSQGIIHGGLKYALTGFLTGSADAVETMPSRWQESLRGVGEIDLRTVQTLSNHQLLWSTGSLTSEISSFFASKALNSRVQKLLPNDYPVALQNPRFKGHVYRLEEIVLDTTSLIETLSRPYAESLLKVNSEKGYQFTTPPDNPLNILSVQINSRKESLQLQAKRYLFTAGEGNATLANQFPKAPEMQCRPLQMVMVKFNALYPFFAHCIDSGMNPRITITTHRTKDGKAVWYLGGQIAEDGVHRTQAEQIAFAKKELHTLFPWVDFSEATWASFFVNRAEPKQPGGKRPESVFVESFENVMVAWPTKLALTPLLTDHIISQLEEQGIKPSFSERDLLKSLSDCEKPVVGLPPWEQLF